MKSLNKIYFDNAATTLIKPKGVAEAVYNAIASEEFANPSRGFYPLSLNSLGLMLDARLEVAKLFSIEDSMRVVFTENITASLNMAIRAFLEPNRHVITTQNEHNSVLRPLFDYIGDVSYVRLKSNGRLNYDDFESMLREDTQAVVLSHASNVSGIVTDIEFIYEFCKKHDLFLIVDGAQSVGCIEVDLNRELPEMVYCFTGHKSLYGPQGTGGMVILTDRKPTQVFSGGSGFDSFNERQPDNVPDIFETGTRNIHSIAGLKAGVEYVNSKGIANIEKDLNQKISYLYNKIKDLEKIELYHDFSGIRTPIVSFNIEGFASEEISEYLVENGIMTRSGIHCAPIHHKVLGTASRGMVRLSLSSFNTYEEIDKVVEIIAQKAV
ncbi:aminotransferase class V-fold PLP-dependent enzyme [Peptoniphilus asaccharolyticus]